ncbi:MAG: ADP-ribosylglycohydrolase family protein, partial [Planctomycetes bacterium]|nr:ADP-ribosylglycohydrolase family protein [Planctomycetota bacterium]
EFRYRGQIIPAERMPKWRPAMINQFNQDDIYVEMTFLRTLEQYGLGVSIRQAGIDFANSGYRLWCANNAGRTNLRRGIAPPDSSHPQFNVHADDIDYQIESDYSGLIAPGMPQVPIDLGEKFGRLMNYGDGMYAGQFIGGMYAEAFFERDIVKVIRAGLRCIPKESQYAEMVRDMLAWYRKNPDDWQKTWQWIEEKYHKNPKYAHGLWNGTKAGGKGARNIDVKLNGAYVLTGLLYGGGEPDRTILIATRCGQDSDCNPSSAGGVLFTTIGFDKLPARFTSAIDPNGHFSHTPYTFPKLIEVCTKLARQAVLAQGGRVEKGPAGEEVFVIPVKAPVPSKLMRSTEPGPTAGSRFTEEEMARIKLPAGRPREKAGTSRGKADISKAAAKFAPGWSVADCGSEMAPGLRAEWGGRKNVLVTHPLSISKPCVLSRKVKLPAGRPKLLLTVGHHPQGDWELVVRADGKELRRQLVGKTTAKNGWLTVDVDLSPLAGKVVTLQLENRANGWRYEAGYWSRIEIVTQQQGTGR